MTAALPYCRFTDLGRSIRSEPMHEVIAAYEAFDSREPGWLKVELKPVA
jgi:threonine dehydrogenase-like Zn-dependent dehydrogenase